MDIVDRLATVLSESGALRFGRFELKSGSISPYFIDFGRVSQGKHLRELGQVFAAKIVETWPECDFDVVFGPAYKGIAIASSIVIALDSDFKKSVKACYNRKEIKGHGADKGALFVGAENLKGKRVIIVDDVFTSGGTKAEIIELLRSDAVGAEVVGMVVGVDRQQHASQGGEVFHQFCSNLQVSGGALATTEALVDCLYKNQAIENEAKQQVLSYIKTGSF